MTAVWLSLALANAWFVGWNLYEISQVGFSRTDWEILSAGARASAPFVETEFRWNPLLLGPLSLLTAMPFGLWATLHFVAVAALPTWPLRILTLISWPFWQDVSTGNVMIFVLVTAVYAIRGQRWAVLTFWTITALIPRPLMLPLAAWLVWRRTDRWAGLVLMVGIFLVGIAADDAWIRTLAASGEDMANSYNWGPSALIGWAWVPLGIVGAAWLTRIGRLGLASLLASPYWLPYYLLMPLLDLDGAAARDRSARLYGTDRVPT
jgi:hypothetical protein